MNDLLLAMTTTARTAEGRDAAMVTDRCTTGEMGKQNPRTPFILSEVLCILSLTKSIY